MEIKNKLLAFEAKHRIVPKVIGAATAFNAVIIPASAEENNVVDISTVTDSMATELTSLVGKVSVACASVVGAGLTIFGIKWAVTKVMAFFRAIGR